MSNQFEASHGEVQRWIDEAAMVVGIDLPNPALGDMWSYADAPEYHSLYTACWRTDLNQDIVLAVAHAIVGHRGPDGPRGVSHGTLAMRVVETIVRARSR